MSAPEVRNSAEHAGSTAFRELGVGIGITERVPQPLTSFVGRDREIERLLDLIQRPDVRLVTLTGPGGVGKTRLALRVVAELGAISGGDVTVIRLASVAESALVLSAIGQLLGATDSGDMPYLDRVATIAGERNRLLVLDNFEHVVDAAPVLTALLAMCPQLRILVTSRTLLRLSGEYAFAVEPLNVPAQDAPLDQIASSEAVRLFQDRAGAGAACEEPPTDESQLPVIAAICRRLDGLPLAIELAAARSQMLNPAELLAGLERGAVPLDQGPRDAPDRLRSMHGTVAWSYDLLTVEEQQMVRLLSVFAGGFTIDAATAVFTRRVRSDTGQPATGTRDAELPRPESIVFSLAGQSLIQRLPATKDQVRFTMLESVRDFGQHALRNQGEEDAARKLHAAWLVELVEQNEHDTLLPPLLASLDPLGGEHDNARAAITWTVGHEQCEAAGKIAAGLWPFWARHGLNSEARDTLRRILRCAIDPVVRASLLLAAARAAFDQSDFVDSRALATEALELCRSLGHRAGTVESLNQLGVAALTDAPQEAVALHREALALCRARGIDAEIAESLNGLGCALVYAGDIQGAKAAFTEELAHTGDTDAWRLWQMLGWAVLAEGDLDRAEELLYAALAEADKLGMPYARACSLRLLGRVHYWRNDLEAAASCYQEAIDVMVPVGALHEVGYSVAELAAVAQAAGEPERAGRWLGFEEAQRGRQRLGLSPDETEIRARATEGARTVLGEDRFAAAWQCGRQLTAEQAITEARTWRAQAGNARASASRLTRREREVLQLLAADYRNYEIAARLFLSRRTVESHVSSILSKLEASSRHAAVRAARTRGLLDD
jgi:predicted ATPase/DNA-binding CsgD family transcriptional regulator